jgi:hypothetical protein
MLSACSSASGRHESGKTDGKGLAIDYGKGNDETPSKQEFLDGNKIFDIGEAVTATDAIPENPDNPGIQYTARKAQLWSSPEEAGISREQMQERQESYNLSTGEPEFWTIDDSGFLLCDVNLKNMNDLNARDAHIGALSLVNVAPSTKEVTLVGYGVYFSKSKNDPKGDRFQHYALPKGKSMDAQVGWLVDLKQYNPKNLYLCVDGQYIRLNLS